jgi:hypothetical protein
MRTKNLSPTPPSASKPGTSGGVAFALLAIGVPWGVWTVFALLGSEDSQLVAFNAVAGWFVVLAFAYLGLHGLRGLAWCSVPVLLTQRALLGFIAVPTWRFATHADQMDSIYVHAMILVLSGFATFWAGSLIFMKENRLRFAPQTRDTSRRIKIISAAMLVVGLITKIVMWKFGLLSYTAQTGAREALIQYMELFVLLGNLLTAALVISAVEVFGKRSAGSFIKIVFWFSISCSVGFGAVSGMKQQLLQPLIVFSLVYGIVKGRIPRAAIFLLPALLILMYPFFNAYRANLNNGYRSQANTISGLEAVVSKSIADVVLSRVSASDKVEGGFDSSANRLSILNDLHDLLGLPAPSLLNGDEKMWLAPVYPLIPRILWKDKPILNKGQRFSEALGRPDTTASAMTTIGDLYSLYGIAGVLIGMFVYGIGLQLYMNWMCRGGISERGLFVYLTLIVPLIAIEINAVTLIAAVVQTGVVAVIVSYLIYGLPHSPSRFARYPRPITAA